MLTFLSAHYLAVIKEAERFKVLKKNALNGMVKGELYLLKMRHVVRCFHKSEKERFKRLMRTDTTFGTGRFKIMEGERQIKWLC